MGLLESCVGLVALLVNDLQILEERTRFYHSHAQTMQVHPSLMCSLVDRVPEPKETQLGTVQPYSAGPAQQSVQEPVVEVSCILISSLVFTLCGTLLQLWHCWVNMRYM